VGVYRQAFERVEGALRHRLGAAGLNFDADADVASVLYTRGEVPHEHWALTKTGKLSVSKATLKPDRFVDPQLASALGYRNRLKTCLSMFMEPWLAQAERTGTIHTNWNSTRGADGGTRTGRPSTNEHNFLNISKSFEGRSDGYVHPAFLEVPPLPLCRRYVLPDEGGVFLHRDFDGQELRVFAHFEQGALHASYTADPALDPHAFVGEELQRVAGRPLERTSIKVLNFQSIYGGGVPALQAALDISRQEAQELKNFHDSALPGRKILAEEIKTLSNSGLPIRTWGGRLYFAEEPRYVEKHGRVMEFTYKLLNYLVQGSAADLTKQALIDWDERNASLPAHEQARFLVTVYDEINISAPLAVAGPRMSDLKVDMEMPRLTVPMRSSGKAGPSWGQLEKTL
jgi:DNA polymerase I-like protein with 3'-5' exonuclease and polymerase domains